MSGTTGTESTTVWGEQVSIETHIEAVAAEGQAFAEAARRGGLDTPIPTCPEWTMRDLVRHLSELHLWAAARVAGRTTKLFPDSLAEIGESWPELAVFWPDDEDLVDWYLRTNANLVEALRSAPADLSAPTFLPASSPLAMWARRQANEITVHRFDAENATGPTTDVDPVLAADGIYEILYGFMSRKREFPATDDEVMHVHADDTGDDWYLKIGPQGISPAQPDGSADLVLTGTASDLYFVLWNRKPDSSIAVTGDDALLGQWHANNRVRWDLG